MSYLWYLLVVFYGAHFLFQETDSFQPLPGRHKPGNAVVDDAHLLKQIAKSRKTIHTATPGNVNVTVISVKKQQTSSNANVINSWYEPIIRKETQRESEESTGGPTLAWQSTTTLKSRGLHLQLWQIVVCIGIGALVVGLLLVVCFYTIYKTFRPIEDSRDGQDVDDRLLVEETDYITEEETTNTYYSSDQYGGVYIGEDSAGPADIVATESYTETYTEEVYYP